MYSGSQVCFLFPFSCLDKYIQDRTVKVWRTEDGVMCRTLSGHAHWINTLALNTDYALRTSCFEPKNGCERPKSIEEAQKIALKRYQDAIKICGGERLVGFLLYVNLLITLGQWIRRLYNVFMEPSGNQDFNCTYDWPSAACESSCFFS